MALDANRLLNNVCAEIKCVENIRFAFRRSTKIFEISNAALQIVSVWWILHQVLVQYASLKVIDGLIIVTIVWYLLNTNAIIVKLI